MAADATYKETEVASGKFTVSYDIKGDPVTPIEGLTIDQSILQMYQVFLKDKQGINRTCIEITVSGYGITEGGSVRDELDGFSNVKEYHREIDGQPATVATGLAEDGIHTWTVFSYYLDQKNRQGLYKNQVLVTCSLPEAEAGDLMNTLHIGKRT